MLRIVGLGCCPDDLTEGGKRAILSADKVLLRTGETPASAGVRALGIPFEEVDSKLKNIMVNIFHNAYNASKEYGDEGNLVMGANVAGFLKVAEAMKAQGVAY